MSRRVESWGRFRLRFAKRETQMGRCDRAFGGGFGPSDFESCACGASDRSGSAAQASRQAPVVKTKPSGATKSKHCVRRRKHARRRTSGSCWPSNTKKRWWRWNSAGEEEEELAAQEAVEARDSREDRRPSSRPKSAQEAAQRAEAGAACAQKRMDEERAAIGQARRKKERAAAARKAEAERAVVAKRAEEDRKRLEDERKRLEEEQCPRCGRPAKTRSSKRRNVRRWTPPHTRRSAKRVSSEETRERIEADARKQHRRHCAPKWKPSSAPKRASAQ